nr:hypothetical protein [Alcaligenes faecalis]
MKKVTYTITAERVFVLTKAVSDGAAGSCGAIAELHSLDDALAVAKALQAATPNSELNCDTLPMSDQERDLIMLSAIRAAEESAIKGCLSAESAAVSVVEAAIKASEAIAQRVVPLVR